MLRKISGPVMKSVYMAHKFLAIEPTLIKIVSRKFVAERLASASRAEPKKNGGHKFYNHRNVENVVTPWLISQEKDFCQQEME
jgi:hypothetical protein